MGDKAKKYTTAQGDMWDSIAHSQLGDAAHMGRLMWANRQFLGHYIFPAGIALALPEIKPGTPGALPPWKRSQR